MTVDVTQEIPVVVNITSIGVSDQHIRCCVQEKFLCRAPYHPEAAAPEGTPEEDCCTSCQKVHRTMPCPPRRPTHEHCPFGMSPAEVCPR